MMNKFERRLQLGYGFTLLILVVVSLVSYLTLQSLVRSNRSVMRSTEVIQSLGELLSLIKDTENGQREYLLTGKEESLQSYNNAYLRADKLIILMQRLTADNRTQQKNIAHIRFLLQQRIINIERLVNRKKQHADIAINDLDAGMVAMDAFRDAVRQAEVIERKVLTLRLLQVDRYSAIVPVFIILAAILAAAVTAYSYRKVVFDIREKERMDRVVEAGGEETQALNEELSALNEELAASNEELMATNDELVKARKELSEANDSLEKKVSERTQALQESEQETQALNEELTATNEELAATNEQLLATNEELAQSQQRLLELVDELRQADERNAKLVAIVESSDDAIIGKNLDGVITSWNRGAEQIFGYKEAYMVGRPILTLIPVHLQHEEPVILERLRNGEKIDHYETIRQTADGRLIHVSLTISPIHDKEGNVIGVSKIARDITEQKHIEQHKLDFIGMASHELKTPLTSLSALIQVLSQKLGNSADSFVSNALDRAKHQTKKMSSLINGFLSVSRLESGKLEIVKELVDLSKLAAEQLDEIRLTTSGHIFTLESDTTVQVWADREKIGSVISNLLSNAVKYSPKGKAITVRCTSNDGNALMSVQDEGMGIKPQDLPNIFDRYYRAESEHTRHISGFGVGLYLSSEIIRRHNGRIWAESKKGIGSTFFFTLPLAQS
ncbi:PAS domain S-box protein [Mucilaginibacter lutimaris]|uniref:histidine kinase n=1 Tax=Mucilaginibacter lutimaris TaxID=931629 RepID=A0ABW2ZEN5_9SPHI